MATTIIRPPEGTAVGASRRLHISPRRDQPDSALYREPWRAVAWECGWVVSAVVPWEASTVVPWEGSAVVAPWAASTVVLGADADLAFGPTRASRRRPEAKGGWRIDSGVRRFARKGIIVFYVMPV